MIEYNWVSELTLETKPAIRCSHLTLFYRFASEEGIKQVKDKIAEMLKSITISEEEKKINSGLPAR